MEFTWGALILIAGFVMTILLGLVARFNSKVKVRKNAGTLMIFFVIVAGIGILSLFVAIPFLNSPVNFQLQTQSIGDEVPEEVSVTNEDGFVKIDGSWKCIGVEDTTVTLSAKNLFTSVATGGTHRYAINGNPALTLSNAGTFTASPGDNLKILWMNGSETDSTYYSDISNVIVPCKGTYTASKDLYQNGTITIEIYNEEGNLIDGLTNNETLTNGDVVSLGLKLKGQYQRGAPFGGVIVAEYPKSQYDDVIVELPGSSKVSTPTFYTTVNGTYIVKTYSVPSVLGNEIVSGTVTVDVDDTLDPTADGLTNITLRWYPNAYFINEQAGGSYGGPVVEDEDGVQIKKYSVLEGLTVN